MVQQQREKHRIGLWFCHCSQTPESFPAPRIQGISSFSQEDIQLCPWTSFRIYCKCHAGVSVTTSPYVTWFLGYFLFVYLCHKESISKCTYFYFLMTLVCLTKAKYLRKQLVFTAERGMECQPSLFLLFFILEMFLCTLHWHPTCGDLDKMIVIFGIESCEPGSRRPELALSSAAISFKLSHQATSQNLSSLSLDNWRQLSPF